MHTAAHSVTSSRTRAARTLGAALALVGSLTACREASAAPGRCEQYPIAWQPAEGALAAARTELASLSADARLTWNSSTGTLSSALPLTVPLHGCTEGADVATQVFDVLAAHPALFQLDLDEWQRPQPFDCKYLGNDELLNMGRRELAGRPVAADVFSYSLKRINGVVHLTAVNGTYLPVVNAATAEAMNACNTLTQPGAVATARAAQLPVHVMSQCHRQRTVHYTPRANDVFQFAPEETWGWQQESNHTLLIGQRRLRVIVDPANYTPDLLSSDARCPVPEGDGDAFTVGFDVVLDVHSGAIVSVKPGLDCIVC